MGFISTNTNYNTYFKKFANFYPKNHSDAISFTMQTKLGLAFVMSLPDKSEGEESTWDGSALSYAGYQQNIAMISLSVAETNALTALQEKKTIESSIAIVKDAAVKIGLPSDHLMELAIDILRKDMSYDCEEPSQRKDEILVILRMPPDKLIEHLNNAAP